MFVLVETREPGLRRKNAEDQKNPCVGWQQSFWTTSNKNPKDAKGFSLVFCQFFNKYL